MAAATERTYATADGRLVPEGHPEAAFLVAAAGDEIPEEYEAKQADPPEDKAVAAPDEDKATKPKRRTAKKG